MQVEIRQDVFHSDSCFWVLIPTFFHKVVEGLLDEASIETPGPVRPATCLDFELYFIRWQPMKNMVANAKLHHELAKVTMVDDMSYHITHARVSINVHCVRDLGFVWIKALGGHPGLSTTNSNCGVIALSKIAQVS
jgi:hypothetical protein